MKIHAPFFSLVIAFCLLAFHPSPASAQVCTGDSGQAGTCKYAMECSPPNIDGTGTCTDPQICCLDNLPPGDGGTGDCTDTCNSSADCLDTPNNLDCTNGVCTNSVICAACTGSSGFAGSCLPSGVCDGMSKNSDDGTGSCTMGSVCCTNAPPSDTCNISAPPITPANADFSVNLTSTDPNISYLITTSPTSCLGSCMGGPLTPGTSGLSCTLSCSIGDYVITASHGNISCTTTVSAQNIPGAVCQGSSGLSGYCTVIACPNGYVGDGMGTCTGPAQCCVRDPSDPFCLPYVSDSGIRTAIGCVHASDPEALTLQIISWVTKIVTGILFLNIVYAGFLYITAGINPERAVEGMQLLFTSLQGLAVIVLAVLILNFFGVRILGLNLFGFIL